MRTFKEFCRQKLEGTSMTGEPISQNTADMFRKFAAELQTKIPKSKVPEKSAQDALAGAMGQIQTIAAATNQKQNTQQQNQQSKGPNTTATQPKYSPQGAGSGMVGGVSGNR